MTLHSLCLGLMSGTSMDGIDVALIDTNAEDYVQSCGSAFYPYTSSFQQALKYAEKIIKEAKGDIEKAAQLFSTPEFASLDDLIQHSTELHINAVNNFINDHQLSLETLDVIGYHGQTFYHAPQDKITLQLGDAQRMANVLQRPIVSQFRLNDIQHGGQGAPLAPIYHWVRATQEGLLPVAVVNCGGIANVTFILDEDPNHMLAFDTGPGNVLIDRLVREKTQGQSFFDQDGALALAGKPHAEALVKCFEEALPANYLSKEPPKSLDSYDCVLPFIIQNLSLEDACASLAMFTAACIVDALSSIKTPPMRWVLAGGGWKNIAISAAFAQLLENKLGSPPQIATAQALGWDHDGLEAEAFAFLAKRSMLNLPISFPGTTGVSQPLTGGIIYSPSN